MCNGGYSECTSAQASCFLERAMLHGLELVAACIDPGPGPAFLVSKIPVRPIHRTEEKYEWSVQERNRYQSTKVPCRVQFVM